MPHELQIEVAEAFADAVDRAALRRAVAALLDAERPGDSGLAVQLADDALLRQLNERHRGIDAPTDVLSFATEEGDAFPDPDAEAARYLGDIAISVEQAAQQALDAGIALDLEVQHLTLHGVLHLLGYDHESDADAADMERREEAILGTGLHRGRVHRDG